MKKGFAPESFRALMRPGYARTVHSVQGIDSKEAFALHETHRYTKRMLNVALTRSHVGFVIV